MIAAYEAQKKVLGRIHKNEGHPSKHKVEVKRKCSEAEYRSINIYFFLY